MRRLALAGLLAACGDPGVDARPSEIVAPTVIAVTVDPPEAEPGDDVTVTVTVATPDGPGDVTDARWARCVAPRPATENNAVPAPCVTGEDGAIEPLGDGGVVTASLSLDACARFGPDPPPGGFRPRDPDPTGGYYQPIRVAIVDEVAFAMARLRCGLANAPVELVQRYAAEYRDNVAPRLTALDVPPSAAAGDELTLAVRWPSTTQERYLGYDPVAEALGTTAERLTVSWFVTGGEVALDRSVGGRDGADTTWRVPAEPGSVHVWAVVRDDRGGVVVIDRAVDVR